MFPLTDAHKSIMCATVYIVHHIVRLKLLVWRSFTKNVSDKLFLAIPRPSHSKAYDIFSIHIIVTSVGHFLEKMYVFCNISFCKKKRRTKKERRNEFVIKIA